jgi:hypothetical protein
MDNFIYINTGDFVESCSAVVEHNDGALELIYWTATEPELKVNETIRRNFSFLTGAKACCRMCRGTKRIT